MTFFILFSNADESCSVFYGPDKYSPLSLGVCDVGSSSCRCTQGKYQLGSTRGQLFPIRISSNKTRTRSKMKKRIKKFSLRPRDRNGVTEQKQTNNKTNTNDKLPKKDRLKLTFRDPKN